MQPAGLVTIRPVTTYDSGRITNRIPRRLKTWLCSVAALLAILGRAEAQTDGIFADFTTSMGSFTCRLEYATAPKAVANFMGLAAGQRSWLDLPTGRVRTNAFYNGLIFHRVIAGFMIQGGSPNGQGTDGPGYSFVDEFSPSLRHDGFGVLSMANSGPDSNGSQFFITADPTPWLDDVHAIFGRLTGGSNVVYTINHVATDSNHKPLTNVVIQNVAIRRVGTAAQAFNISTQGLALVTNLPVKIARAGTNVSLTFSNRLNADNRLFSSTNLATWTEAGMGIEVAAPTTNAVYFGAGAAKQFFHVAQVQYPASLFVPRNVLGRTVTLSFSTGPGIIVISFNNSGGGTYTWSLGGPGTVDSYTWIQDPYRGRLYPIYFSKIIPMVLHLDYDSATAGTMKGTAYPTLGNPMAVSGTFTSTP